MEENRSQVLNGVAETLIFPLYVRALESRRPDALVKDTLAEEIIGRMDYDFEKIKQIGMDDMDIATLVLRSREFDRRAADFLARHPDAVVVHIGCGLDTRFERVGNGRAEWYDLDVPEVIALRRQLIGGEEGCYHLLESSAFDLEWMDRLAAHGPRPVLFMAEGVFMYFPEEQIKRLVLALRGRFPGAELVFDAFSPFLVRMSNLRFGRTGFGARYHWGLKRGKDVETWAPGIHLLDEWSYFDRPEPRLEKVRWMRYVPFFARVMAVYCFRLDNDGQ